jgi:cystathionine beta-lyase
MKYNFDEIINRQHTNALNTDGFRQYIFKADSEATFRFKDEEFIRMWIADMEFATAPEIRDAMKARIDKKIFGYSVIYDDKYYKAFSKWCKDMYDWEFPQEQLKFSPGIIPALYQIAEELVKPDGKILTVTPAYGYFLHAANYNDVELIGSPLKWTDNGYVIDFEDFENKLKDPAVKLVMWCNPHNPTGRVWTDEEQKKVAQLIEKYDKWVLSDEIHCDLLRHGIKHTPMAKIMPDYDKLITCMSASKAFNMAGLMHSNVIIRNEAFRDHFAQRDKLIGTVNPISIEAHKAAYEHGGQWLSELKTYLDGNFAFVKDFFDKNIPDAVCYIPDATYLAWIDMRKVLPDVTDLCGFFAHNAGVLLESGDALFVGNAEGYVRLNLAMPRALIEEGLKRMAKAIAEHR